MNLHALAAPIVAAVNPHATVQLRVSTGSSTQAPDGTPVPDYAAPVPVEAQIQALTFKDLTQLDGLNLQGTQRAIYFYDRVEGLVRADNRGGDLITFPDNSVWLVSKVLETWDDAPNGAAWCKVAVTLQNGA